MDNFSIFTFSKRIPEASAYANLFESTDWNQMYQADEQDLNIALSNSWYTIPAYNAENELIGFSRVVSAGILLKPGRHWHPRTSGRSRRTV